MIYRLNNLKVQNDAPNSHLLTLSQREINHLNKIVNGMFAKSEGVCELDVIHGRKEGRKGMNAWTVTYLVNIMKGRSHGGGVVEPLLLRV